PQMTLDTFIALATLAFIAAWTPGPNNLMLASSGVNFGFWRTLPHMMGVTFGFPVMIFLVAMGIGALIVASPIAREAMRWGGAALLVWFAWRIATAGRAEADGRSRPLTFFEAAGFQWINPKGWAMALATTAQFVTGGTIIIESLLCALAYTMAGLGSSVVWAGAGVQLRRFLSNDARLRVFNIVMGVLIASFVVFLFRDEF
ncbi:MAG: LysE family translocator, partial [Pseudomonadota bacterium]